MAMLRLQKSTVGGSQGPKIAIFAKKLAIFVIICSDFSYYPILGAIFGQYSFQQCHFLAPGDARF